MKVAARFIFLFIGIVILAPAFSSAQQTVAGLAGTWSGRTTRAGTAKSSTTNVIVILDGSGAGFIEYPKLKCGGTLRFLGKSGNTLSYQETITHGKTSCLQDGRVDVIPSGGTLAWTWTAGQDKATGTLTDSQASAMLGCVACAVNYDNDIQVCYRLANSTDQQRCQDNAEETSRSCRSTCKD